MYDRVRKPVHSSGIESWVGQAVTMLDSRLLPVNQEITAAVENLFHALTL